MLKSGEEILANIDTTLDQLIQNAEVMRFSSIKTLQENEIEALQKTQESLLAHLIHMDDLLDTAKKKIQIRKKNSYMNIQQKIVQFGQLNAKMIDNVATRFAVKGKKKKPIKARISRSRKVGVLKSLSSK